jgi:ATPase family associated with various cellular activities (AAA)
MRRVIAMGDGSNPSTRSGFAPLFDALRQLLAIAVERQAARLGPASLLDPWRGMYLSVDDVRVALGAPPLDDPALDAGAAARIASLARGVPRLAQVAGWLGLCDEDLAIIALAFAPDVDLRFERIYGYLQDDVTRKRPGMDLVANLLCAGADERLSLFARFDPQAPLSHSGVIEWSATGDAPLLSRALSLDPLWRNYLLGRDEMDTRLARHARLLPTGVRGVDEAFVEPEIRQCVKSAMASTQAGEDLRLVLLGPNGAGKATLASSMARDLGLRLLALDVRDLASVPEMVATLDRAGKASALMGALLYLHGTGPLTHRDPQLLRAMVETLGGLRTWFVLALNAPLPQMHTAALRVRQITLGHATVAMRLAAWQAELAAHDVQADAADVQRVASQFRMSCAQIAQAVADTIGLTRPMQARRVTGDELAATARARCGDELARLAQRIAPQATFEALIATPEVDAQLREICSRVATREAVRASWTRDCVHARSSGITALFAGPSGTGKTFAAEAVARELGLDLFRIDLSAVVSKYIGETEKNLDRVFAAAENANAVLFFDEADALFGKRSEVKDAHDRYANIEIAYLLQKMEQFDGLAILATNLKQNLDDAFARRLAFSVNFAFPEEAERLRLWEALWPPHAPRAEDIDFAKLAGDYALSGGNIRNLVLAAAHLAAANGQVITNGHLLHATRREYQKLGKHIGAKPAATGVGSA